MFQRFRPQYIQQHFSLQGSKVSKALLSEKLCRLDSDWQLPNKYCYYGKVIAVCFELAFCPRPGIREDKQICAHLRISRQNQIIFTREVESMEKKLNGKVRSRATLTFARTVKLSVIQTHIMGLEALLPRDNARCQKC